MIQFYENQLEDILSWSNLGKNNADYFLEAVKDKELKGDLLQRKHEYEYIQNVCKALDPF